MKEYISVDDFKRFLLWHNITIDKIPFPTVTDLDICKLFAVRFVSIVKSIGKQMGVELDDTTAMEIFNMMFSEMESKE